MVCFDSVRRVLITLRIADTGLSSYAAPGHAAVAVGAGAEPARAASTSAASTRPWGPEPLRAWRSSDALLFFRIVFASGLMNTRSPDWVGAGAAGVAGVAGAAG